MNVNQKIIFILVFVLWRSITQHRGGFLRIWLFESQMNTLNATLSFQNLVCKLGCVSRNKT